MIGFSYQILKAKVSTTVRKRKMTQQNETKAQYHDSFRATIPTCSMAIFGKLVSLLSLTP